MRLARLDRSLPQSQSQPRSTRLTIIALHVGARWSTLQSMIWSRVHIVECRARDESRASRTTRLPQPLLQLLMEVLAEHWNIGNGVMELGKEKGTLGDGITKVRAEWWAFLTLSMIIDGSLLKKLACGVNMGWMLSPLLLLVVPCVWSDGSAREKFNYASRRIQDQAFLESATEKDRGGTFCRVFHTYQV